MSPIESAKHAPLVGTRGNVLLGPWPAILIGAACFLNSLANDFVYDDVAIVAYNPLVKDVTNWRGIWLRDWWAGYTAELPVPDPRRDRLYRPLTLFSFAAQYSIHGLWTVGYHATNVALHAGMCGLVWLLALRLFGDRAVAALAALLFAVHPVHAEAVANVVGRAEVLAAIFLALGICTLLARDELPGVRRVLASTVCFLLALLAKETAICYPAVAFLALHARYGRGPGGVRRLARPSLLLLLLPVLIYLPTRYLALENHLMRPGPTSDMFNPLFSADAAERLVGVLTILGHYGRLLLVPRILSSDYGLAVFDPESGATSMTVAGVAVLLVLLVCLFGYRRPGPTWFPLASCTAMALASYALISNTVLLIGVSLAERLIYWPSAPLLIGLAVVLVGFWRRFCGPGGRFERSARALRYVGAAMLVGLALRTIARNADWASNDALFAADVATYPQGAHLNAAMGGALLRQADKAANPAVRRDLILRAQQYLNTSLSIYPRSPDALLDLGRIRVFLEDLAGAQRYFEAAGQIEPRNPLPRQYLAQLRGDHSDRESRIATLRASVDAAPRDAEARIQLGELLLEAGRQYEALPQLRAATELAPDEARGWEFLGQALLLTDQPDEALVALRRAIALNPENWTTHSNLAVLLAGTDPPASLRHAQEAARLNPRDIRMQINLAESLGDNKRYAEAVELLRQVQRSLPPESPLAPAVAERIRQIRQDHGLP